MTHYTLDRLARAMSAAPMPWPKRRALAERGNASRAVTLDGKPAVICATLDSFAVVAALDGSARVSFCWRTVERVLANGGRFEA